MGPADGLTAEAGINEVTLTWTNPSDGPAPEGVYLDVTGPDGFAKVVAIPGPATQSTVSGLRNGVTYSFQVITATRDGSAAASNSVTATPSTGMEGVVAGLIVEFEPGSEKTKGEQNVPGEDRVGDVDLAVAEKVNDDAVLVELSEPVDVDTATRIASDLAADEEVAWAEPDQFFFTSSQLASDDRAQVVTVPSDSQYASSQWNLWDSFGITIGDGNDAMTDAWDGPRGDGVTVAVIDTGITDHPDLVNQLVPGYDFVSNPDKLAAVRQANAPSVDFDGDYVDAATYGELGRDSNPTDPGDWRGVSPIRDSSWHGTKVAGVIAAEANNNGITGIAPGAKIQPIRALSWRGGLLSDIAASITWASGGTIDSVPANANPGKVINMSFAVETTCPVALQDAIDGAIERGSILIAAAGNASDEASKFAPGNCNGVMTVAATNRDGQRADYSNYGDTIDIAAPGGDAANPITVTTNTGTQTPNAAAAATTATDSGTSIAAAHVSAAAAILASRSAGLTPDLAYETLTGSRYTKAFGNDVCDAGNPDYACGTGILSLAQIAATVGTAPCIATVASTSGVTASQDDGDCVLQFTSNNSFTPPTGVDSVHYLIVAGGGGGGGDWAGGGGGAGGLATSYPSGAPLGVTAGAALTITVGNGGAGGSGGGVGAGDRGQNSSITGGSPVLILTGGGGGASSAQAALDGGSGGGGSTVPTAGGQASPAGQGNSGGGGAANTAAGGGGGAGASGGNGSGAQSGSGGAGLPNSITGSSVTYAGGGGGGADDGGAAGLGTVGGGGAGGSRTRGSNGAANTGGGGGGSGLSGNPGGDGGSGIVILRYSNPSNATLSSIVLNDGSGSVSLSPTFTSAGTSYSASVLHAISSVTVTPTTNGGTVTVNGVAVTSGTPSSSIPLNVGANTITVIGTAPDTTTTKTYTITVTRLSDDATLSSIVLNDGSGSVSLSPTFTSAGTSYSASVLHAISSVTVTPTTNGGTVTVNGVAVTSGTPSSSIPLNVGANTITVIGVAEDPAYTKTYIITVTRLSDDATLSDLEITGNGSAVPISPTFTSAGTSYTASVDHAVSSVTVTPTTNESGASVTVDGEAVASGNASSSISLAVGQNEIPVVVTASDPTYTTTYTITITRAPAPTPSPPAPAPSGDAQTPVEAVTPPTSVMDGEELAVVTEGDSVVPVVLRPTEQDDGWEAIGAGFGMVVRTEQPDGSPVPLAEDRRLAVPQGGRVQVAGDGYQVESVVRVFMVPRTTTRSGLMPRAVAGAVYLGETTVDSTGDFAATFTVPLSVTIGDYVLQINGVSSKGAVRSFNMGMLVEPGAAPVRLGMTQRGGFFKGLSDELSKRGERKIRTLVRSMPDTAQAVQVEVTGVSVGLDSLKANAALAAERATRLAEELAERGIEGKFTVTVTTTFTVDGTERAVAGTSDILTTNAGKPLSTVTVLFQEPVSP